MRKSMVYPIRFWALVLSCLLIYQFSTEASADWCKFEKDIDLTLDMSASDVLAVFAAAGDLEIVGVSGSDQAVIRGRACASKESWLEKIEVSTTHFCNTKIPVTRQLLQHPITQPGHQFTIKARVDHADIIIRQL